MQSRGAKEFNLTPELLRVPRKAAHTPQSVYGERAFLLTPGSLQPAALAEQQWAEQQKHCGAECVSRNLPLLPPPLNGGWPSAFAPFFQISQETNQTFFHFLLPGQSLINPIPAAHHILTVMLHGFIPRTARALRLGNNPKPLKIEQECLGFLAGLSEPP